MAKIIGPVSISHKAKQFREASKAANLVPIVTTLLFFEHSWTSDASEATRFEYDGSPKELSQ